MICPIAPLAGWERWISLHEIDDTDHIVYRSGASHDANERRRLLAGIERLARVRHGHLLPVDGFSFDENGRLAFVCPYTGNQEGLLTISDLVARRSGRLDLPEVQRCVAHLLDGIAAGRAEGLSEAQLDRSRILVDRRGCVLYEVYGLTGVPACEAGAIPESDEVRLVAQFAAWLLTGIDPTLAQVSVARVAGRAARGWDAWISAATDPLEGFETITDAIRALPSNGPGGAAPGEPGAGRVGTALGAPFGAMVRRFRTDQAARRVGPERTSS